ncbi:hypothetical protein APHAL10511_007915 [Amanita phalloides]|nr:hypothetical protein APHAL10511_007915 [Amanita phalloides]
MPLNNNSGGTVSAIALFYEMWEALGHLGTMRDIFCAVVRVQAVDAGFPSADLSTPQGTYKYIGRLFRAVMTGKESRKTAEQKFELYVEFLESGKLSAEKTEAIHKIGRDTAEEVHAAFQRLQSASGDESVADVAIDIFEILSGQLSVIDETFHSSVALEIAKVLASMERKSKSDIYNVVG